MAEKLTFEQQLAVDDRGGKLLVSAAAGSGKTKVLVDRLLKYLADPTEPANIDDFLIITYTKAAAAELRAKIAAKLSERIADNPSSRHMQRQLQRLYLTKISTVHAFCADILREYAYRLDISADFRVADENECIQLRHRAMEGVLEQAYETIGFDPDFQAFADTQGLGRNDALVPEIVEKVYDSASCHLDPDKWLCKCIENTQVDAQLDASQTLWGKYLVDDLFLCLDAQIKALNCCADAVQLVQGQAKAELLLRDTVNQLEHLRQSTTWDEIVARKNIDYGRLTFASKTNDPAVSEPVKAVRKACREMLDKKLRNFSDTNAVILADLTASAAAARGLIGLVRQFSETYARLKRNRRVLDFSDLEQKTLDLLVGRSRTTPTAAAEEISQRFREIMVDEYQDSNGVQDAIFSALTQKRQNLFMVGDVKQSIYQFRLADPNIFLEKYNDYAAALDAVQGQGRKVQLSSNFRSSGGVIAGVNDVFRDCMTASLGGLDYGDDEALREGIPHIPLCEPEVELHAIDVAEDTYTEEAEFVAQHIQTLLDGTHMVRKGDALVPITEDDIVILLRSPGSVGAHFQAALEARGIRSSSGGSRDLFLTEEVGTLRALLQTISNPRQDIPLLTVLASPVFGFSADDLAVIRAHNKRSCIYDALVECCNEKTERFLSALRFLREAAGMHTLPELLAYIFHLTRLDSIYAAMPDGEVRKGNIQAFYQLAVNFSQLGNGDLDRFLSHLETMEEKGLMIPQEAQNGCITIMSIHKSKGLEFPVVFLCGLSRRFNKESLNAQVLCDRELGLGLSCVDVNNRLRYPALSKRAIAVKMALEGLSEELRVLYVAMTRARDRLIMTYASQWLENDITQLVQRMDLSDKVLITTDVSCPGQWVLYCALRRTEAGALFAAGGKPQETFVKDSPWLIAVHSGTNTVQQIPAGSVQHTQTHTQNIDFDAMRQNLAFQYPYQPATVTPSKQTATQRKGRIKDIEIAENADIPKHTERTWRAPGFTTDVQHGKAYGTVIHTLMQYLDYKACTDLQSIALEVQRLMQDGFLTQAQRDAVDCDKLLHFFTSEVGKKLRTHSNVLREFKFSILDGASLEGEQVLLQGVVDCAFIDDDGITVLDFKTDYVTEETVDTIIARHACQVETYAEALARIFELPVKAKAIYLFHIDRLVWL